VTPERARLFVALELPDPVRDALLAWRQSAIGDDQAWRPVAPTALHVTLCFLGDQRVEEIGAIAQACKAGLSDREISTLEAERDIPTVAAPVLSLAAPVLSLAAPVLSLAAPVLSLAAPLLLGPRRARVLAIALEDFRQALAVIQRRLAECLAAGGWYQPESRPFLAHVTVARARRGSRVPAAPAYPAPPSVSFDATTISLLRSRLGGQGARYERLAAVNLTPSTRR
jgi:RNA 2',3'-cyclic 3'-phosphodiesterase